MGIAIVAFRDQRGFYNETEGCETNKKSTAYLKAALFDFLAVTALVIGILGATSTGISGMPEALSYTMIAISATLLLPYLLFAVYITLVISIAGGVMCCMVPKWLKTSEDGAAVSPSDPQ